MNAPPPYVTYLALVQEAVQRQALHISQPRERDDIALAKADRGPRSSDLKHRVGHPVEHKMIDAHDKALDRIPAGSGGKDEEISPGAAG